MHAVLNVEIGRSTCRTLLNAVERNRDGVLFCPTSCHLLNGANQVFSSLKLVTHDSKSSNICYSLMNSKGRREGRGRKPLPTSERDDTAGTLAFTLHTSKCIKNITVLSVAFQLICCLSLSSASVSLYFN